MPRLLTLVAALQSLASGGEVPSRAHMPHAAIDHAVAAFLETQAEPRRGVPEPVDRRLRLAVCPVPLTLAWLSGSSHVVTVECRTRGGWRLFVAVRGAEVPPETRPHTLRRGETVRLQVVGPAFTVTATAKVLGPADEDGWITVQPADRAAPLRARLVHPGLATVAVR
ncbi:flagella basal body P-ring formation protein FlgA [Qipengyuania thermophila]|uniref:flagella basal body P-ring formation protein FlgA n=1 Tax=Qipengyuania thermophila TaxID=2509361 RepID=UPI0013ECD7CC|nr:flagella basal body P-ring formation protein FlgA [Qipengyuania thermophila]